MGGPGTAGAAWEGFQVSLRPLPERQALGALWRELEGRGDPSFFQTWHWIGTWLACLARPRARLLQVEERGRVAGLAVLCGRTVRRHRILRSRGLFLNCTGDPTLDEISIEHNGFLARRGGEREVTRAAIEYLLRQGGWDELFMDGMCRAEVLEGPPVPGVTVRSVYTSPSRYVDLAALRASGAGYVEGLRRQARYNIRRSLREYEHRGPIALDEAETLEEAREYLGRLAQLHQRYWERKGKPGAFSNAFFAGFQDRLLEAAFGAGCIQLLRARAGAVELGYLYNFVHRGRVYNYQSGFNYTEGHVHERPGLVAHVLAIEHNLRRGHAMYDFLAGDSEFKRSLAAGCETLDWKVVQRPRLKLRLEDRLRRARARWMQARGPVPAPAPEGRGR